MTFEDPKDPYPATRVSFPTQTIPPEDRLIFALDVPSVEEAKRLVTTLREAVQFYKVGLELFATGGYFEPSTGSSARARRSRGPQALRRPRDRALRRPPTRRRFEMPSLPWTVSG